MKNNTQSVSKTEWGSARAEFESRLPEILELFHTGKNRTDIYGSLNLSLLYSQFCRHLKKQLNNSDKPIHPQVIPTTVFGDHAVKVCQKADKNMAIKVVGHLKLNSFTDHSSRQKTSLLEVLVSNSKDNAKLLFTNR